MKLNAEALPPIRPAALQPGDTIAVVAPAGRLDAERVELAAARLREAGYRVKIPSDLYRTRGYLAGEDAIRAAELMAAFLDPEVKAIFPGTGGYGSTRILQMLDYEAIRKNPKIFFGFSDLTAIHLALQKKVGLISFHGPNLMYGLGSPRNLAPISKQYLWRALSPGNPVVSSDPDHPLRSSRGSHEPGYTIDIPAGVGELRRLVPGRARARLTGGNLSLICALMGTEFEMETDGRILFIEDVDEPPYRVDRYLSQLKLAGKLDRTAGVLLGQFTGCQPRKKESLTLDEVFDDYFSDLEVPVLMNFPAGHYRHNVTLPIGGLIEIDADRLAVRVLEDPVAAPDQAAAIETRIEPVTE